MTPTLSLCIPSTCISSSSCRSQQHATHVLHQISRAATLYGATEIIVYDIPLESSPDKPKKVVFEENEAKVGPASSRDSIRAAELLQYFVTPSYLRNSVFDDSKPFQYAKKLPKPPGLPFLNQKGRFLEGLTVGSKVIKSCKKKSKKSKQLDESTEYVNVGLDEMLKLEERLPVNKRVTVDVRSRKTVKDVYSNDKPFSCETFGYRVRMASSFGRIFTESIFADGYSFTAFVPSEEFTGNLVDASSKIRQVELLSNNKHLLLIYGKWKEIERAVQADKDLPPVEPFEMFDGRLQCRRGARTEDAVWMSLAKVDG